MSNSQRIHSVQSKEKISSSLRQLWAKRLKWKRSQEKFYCSWAESIAESARRGGIDEEELSWDSYQMLQEQIASIHLQRASEKAKEKEMKRRRAEKRAQDKAKKMVSLVRKKMDGKQKTVPKAKQRGRSKNKTRQKKVELATSGESNNNARFTKDNANKILNGTFCNQAGVMHYLQSALEKFDIEYIKRELGRSTVSLADQIQAAKRKRTEAIASGSVIKTSLGS